MEGRKRIPKIETQIVPDTETDTITHEVSSTSLFDRIGISSSRQEENEKLEIETEDEYELKWAAIERLPTVQRLRTALFQQFDDVKINSINIANSMGIEKSTGAQKKVVDVKRLSAIERRLFIDKLMEHIQRDNLRLLQKQRQRIDRVNVELPTIEVRYTNLCVEAKCQVVQGKPLPTIWNSFLTVISGLTRIPGLTNQEATVRILKDVSGIIKPSRMTLLLGPPGCGKTTFLKALAGKLNNSLKVTGEITYNGYKLNEFVPQKTATYISQNDLHIAEMTVRETLDFSARFQGIGNRAEIMKEVLRREKQQGITPDPDIDAYMKAISVEGQESSLQTEYIMKIMGLDICADIMVGDVMRRGISGGEKKRLTTGEMIVGPSKALFMDEISTGLDSSTTHQIVTCLQQLTHITDSTVLISLLQPAPETYDLFDDVILMAEGKIVYHGPRMHILHFFELCGFMCPERKGAADFIQEVLSRRDQEQYWSNRPEEYSYMTVDQFIEKFKSFQIGQSLSDELSKPFNKSKCHKNALAFSVYSLSRWELFKACLARELLLMKRNSFVYIFKSTQLGLIAIVTGTVFLRTRMGVDTLHANYYLGALFYALILTMVNGFPELAMTLTRLQVFYKQRDCYFYPSWAYAIPASLLKIPVSLLESLVWTSITYFLIGYSPEASRFFRQLLILFFLHTMSLSMMRCVASYCQTMVASFMCAPMLVLVQLLFGGFLLPKSSMPGWLKWGFWASPLTYTELGLALNEFLAPRWREMLPSNITLGRQVLVNRGLNYSGHLYWLSAAALLGYIILFNAGFTLSLTFRRPVGSGMAIISRERLSEIQGKDANKHRKDGSTMTPNISAKNTPQARDGKMVLPFIPLTLTFHDVNYYVDTPPEMREHGHMEKRLQLLHNITGAFRPGILSAIMGVTGAGKTTLLDVLSGRKTGGYIEGDIRIGGYPKVQKTFARISGYCEQTDIHSPHITVAESVAYSAWLRLSPEIASETRNEFVNEVLETIELHLIRDELVGIPGVNGLSTEQRKRLTIAVELVSNPSVIFMDEPTSGLDARAAAIVMRAVKNVAETGRTVVCTIHQPSIDIFEAFDELILMKRGGEMIYSGPLGQCSSRVIQYFEGISGVPKIGKNYNPATWMMEITSRSVEAQLSIDFAQVFKDSYLYKENKILADQLSKPPPGSDDLNFPTQYPQSFWGQFKACLWKQHLSYWRNPSYNLVRIVFMIVTSAAFSFLYWKHGNNINNEQDLFNILGCMYSTTLFTGINNCQSIMPVVSMERAVVCRENFAGMYSPWAYSFAQVSIEIPYVLVQVVLFMVIVYPSIGYAWTAAKVLWFSYVMICSLLFYLYFGMMLTALTPNFQVASILASVYYTLSNLFSGFIVPRLQIPGWWIWLYYICPLAWALDGLFTSQYGDVDKEILVFGEKKSVSTFLGDYFGFHHHRLPLAAVMVLIFPILFACLFAHFTNKLNFQSR
ncbi:hypothetical protein LUZ61_016585 [Rhynchospora tenuis]|uniref:ABC transporter domain-containing protein n=1 Tax=Rhynchospora tenuis TaxID=198213 RepID=A0AAD6EK50_9POAL|nr:hypothetical protein LUZ61_016585 [Rhynchospora tenuis]